MPKCAQKTVDIADIVREAMLRQLRYPDFSAHRDIALSEWFAKAEADRFATESRAHLRAQIERRTQMAHEKIQMAEAQAMAEIRSAAADIATLAAEKLIAARLDEARAGSLIAQSIKELPDKLN